MRWILTVGTTVRAIGAVTPLVSLLVTVVTDNKARGWVWGWWMSRVRSHGPMTLVIEVAFITPGTSSTKTDSGRQSTT